MLYQIWAARGWKNLKSSRFNKSTMRMTAIRIFIFAIICMFNSNVCVAEEYSFALGSFGNRVNFTNADDDAVVQVSKSISDYLVAELMDCPKIRLYDKTEDISQARANEIMLLTDQEKSVEEYKKIACEYIICGALSNLGISHTNTSVIGIGGNSYVVRVDISLKILAARTGKCIYIVTGKGESCSEDFNFAPLGIKLMHFGDIEFATECYDAALQKAVQDAVVKIKRDI